MQNDLNSIENKGYGKEMAAEAARSAVSYTHLGEKGFWAPQYFKDKRTYYFTYTANEQTAVSYTHLR